MGLVKRAMMDIEERGWDETDKSVCEDCVNDSFLKDQIREARQATHCDYCGRSSRKPVAAPVDVILETVLRTVGYFFSEPTQAGMPYDGGWLAR